MSVNISNLLDFVKISYDEMKIYTEQATANINSHVNSVTNNLKDKVELTISQTNMMTRQFMNVNNSALSKITSTTDQTIASMQKLSAKLRDESAKIISETNSKMNQLMTTNDANLKKSLETLGRAMLKISDKFVEDYMPLVNELKKIVEIAKQVRLPAR